MDNKAFKFVFCLLVASISMACSQNSNGGVMTLDGVLVYGSSDSIHALELTSLKDRVVYKESEGRSLFMRLTKIDDNRILFEDDAYHLIKELNLGSGVISTIRSGYGPQYIAEYQKMFFYDALPNKGAVGLFMASLDKPIESARVVHEGPFVVPVQVIQVSNNSVVFDQGKKIYKYNIESNLLEELTIEGCSQPKAFRDSTGQLLCFDASKKEYFLTDFDGGDRKYLPVLGSNEIALYLSEFDTLVFGEARFQLFPNMGEVQDIWMYDFKEEQKRLIEKNISIGLGGAVWVK